MVYKNSKKKNNDLKPVIKTSYKKINRKQNRKKIGGFPSWSGIKEGFQKSIGRVKGKGVKVGDKIEFLSRQQRGLSQFKIGQNYRSGKQIESRMDYMTKRINEKKQIFTKVNGKLAGRQSKFRSIVNNKYEKLEIEMAEESAKLKSQLTKGKINQSQFDTKIAEIGKKKEKTMAEIELIKKNFTERNKDLIKKVEEKKKDLIKISDKYKPNIEKLTLKLRTKVRKSTKLLDTGLRRTCKKLPKSESCFGALEACRAKPEIIGKAKIIACMSSEGFTDQNFVRDLDANILKTKLYYSPSRRRKIRARSERITRLPQTIEIKDKTQIVLKDTQKLKDLKKVQNEVKPYKTSEIYSDTVLNRTKGNLQKIQQQERADIVQTQSTQLTQEMNKTNAIALKKFNQTNIALKKVKQEEKDKAKQLIKNTKAKRDALLAEQTAEQEAKIAREAAEREAKEKVEQKAKEAAEREALLMGATEA